MLIIPAIDIQDGCVVRFFQGNLDKKVYSRNPLNTARNWVRQGANLLHVVDLDGAATGKPRNGGIVKEIARNIGVPVQYGGGLRDLRQIGEMLDCGVERVVLGTRAAEDRVFVKKAFDKFQGRVIVSIDTRLGKVSTRGWDNNLKGMDALKFARLLRGVGFQEFIYTDILKDGSLSGPNIKEVKRLLKETRMRIIASGGVSSLKDLRELKRLEKYGLSAVIIGKALYERKFTLSEAIRLS